MNTRSAAPADFDGLVTIWYEGWHDGYAQIVPTQMRQARTTQNFRERVEDTYGDMKVIGEIGAPRGFHIVKHEERAHLYVDRYARGSRRVVRNEFPGRIA